MRKRERIFMRIVSGLGVLGIILVAGIVVVTIIFCSISTGKINGYTDENGDNLNNSIAEKLIVNLNGADNGLFIKGKNLDNPVLLFVSSGPGTSDFFYNEEYPDMNLSDYFTVCYWDYRGMCMVYDEKIEPSSITSEVIHEDTLAVTRYLKERFGKEKIYIMGFSGGTHIALQAVSLYPDEYYAYFAMSQVVCSGEDNDTLMYDFMKLVFNERKDIKRLKKLEKAVHHNENGKVECNDWAQYVKLVHDAGGGTIKDKSEFEGIVIPLFKSHCYTVKEKLNYIPGMKLYRMSEFSKENKSRDYRKEITKIDVPIYFISGEYDYNCPWPLVEEYYNIIEAPDKGMILVPDAAHSPLWENPQIVVDYIRDAPRNKTMSLS